MIDLNVRKDVESKLRDYENRVTYLSFNYLFVSKINLIYFYVFSVLIAEIEKHAIVFNDKARECDAWKQRYESLKDEQ